MNEELLKIIKEKSLKFGKFSLRSKKKSNLYFNLKNTLLDHHGLNLIVKSIMKYIIIPDEITAVGGIATGSIPIISGIVKEKDIRAFYIRKKPKKGGDKSLIEGNVYPTDKVLLIDDVITSGKSIYKAVQELSKRYINVDQVYGIIDRGAFDFFKDKNIKYSSLFNEYRFIDIKYIND